MSGEEMVLQGWKQGMRKEERHRLAMRNELKERRKNAAGIKDPERIIWPMTLPQLRVTQGNPRSQGLPGPQRSEALHQPENNCGHHRG